MGLVNRFMAAISVAGVQPSNPPDWMVRMFGGTGSSSGVQITESNAMTVADVYKCVTVIRETIAMLPWKMYKRMDPRGKVEAPNHPLYFILHDEPNDMMTSFTYKEAMLSHILLWGRHVSYIERNATTGKIVALWPLRPDRVRYEIKDGQRWWYACSDLGQEAQFWDDEILYIPAYTTDGYNSVSPVRLHFEAFGLAKATEIYGAKLFGNGSTPPGYLSHPQTLKKESAARLKEQWQKLQGGLNNAHRIAVLEEGVTFKTLSMPNDEAQFLETRNFQRTEVNGIYRVPPHKTGDLRFATFSNIENQDQQFYNDAVTPRLVQIEQACNRCLLLPKEKGKFFNAFVMKGALRGDTAARTDHYQKMFDRGVYSADDILESEDENLIGGKNGNRRYVPMNFIPTDLVDQVLTAHPPPPDPAEDSGAGPQPPAKPDPMNAVRLACGRFFKDAAGRVSKRKPAEREKYAQTAFLQPVLAVIECILGKVSPKDEQFSVSFSSQIAKSTPSWEAENSETNAIAELENTIQAVLKRGNNEES
jgi:HK97 family phage portal protein